MAELGDVVMPVPGKWHLVLESERPTFDLGYPRDASGMVQRSEDRDGMMAEPRVIPEQKPTQPDYSRSETTTSDSNHLRHRPNDARSFAGSSPSASSSTIRASNV